MNQDVLIGSIADSPSMNRYAYVQGNPISLADPFGLSPSINWKQFGHAALDVLGMIPGVGFVFDAVNAVWYFADGDMFAGVCSLISALPGVGDAIGGAVIAAKYTKIGCAVINGTKIAAHAATMIKGSYVIGNVIRNNIERYAINGVKFSPAQLAMDLFTVGMELFATGSAANGLKGTEVISGKITNDVIHNLQKIDVFEDDSINQAVLKHTKKLLRKAKKYAVGTEIGKHVPLDLNRKKVKTIIGDEGEYAIKLGKCEVPAVTIHNHPSGETFSGKDIDNFILDENARAMYVIGNNGKWYVLRKNDDFNWMQFQMKTLDISDADDFNEQVIKAANNYGLTYYHKG